MKTIRIGIIGCGKQAPKHISGLRKIPGVEVVLADVIPSNARQLAESENLSWAESPEEILKDTTINAVSICTPTPTHCKLAEQAVRAGKDFFCEKPLCLDPVEGRELKRLVDQAGQIGMVGYVYRFAPAFELAKGLLRDAHATGESDVLGRLRFAFLRLGGRGSHQLWKHRRATDGGATNEMLVHMVDLAIWFFGRIKEVHLAARETLLAQREIQGKMETVDTEDYVVVRLKTESGVEVLCQADLVTPAFTQMLEIQGDNGTFMGSIQAELPTFVYCKQEASGYPAGRTPINFGSRNLFEAQMAEFVRAVRTRSQPSRCTIEDSVILLETLERIACK